MGGGAINDYGRGVWAAEIASRSLYPKSKTVDEISQESGFLGNGEKLPWWIRPDIKYRGLALEKDPKGTNQSDKFYGMALDVGASVLLDQEQKYLLYGDFGYVPSNEATAGSSMTRFVPRDYYLRVQLAEPLWLYVGKIEKVFGIRNVDHTSYNRAPLELTENSQSHGVVAHYIQDKYEIAGNVFVGAQDALSPKQEQKGFSIFSEYEFIPHSRGGISLMRSRNDMDKDLQFAAHWRQGLSHGSALLFEYGLLNKNDKNLGLKSNGSYSFVESTILLVQGYNLLLNLERYNADAGAGLPEQWKFGLGLLAFPINRVEVRLGAVHYRQVSSEEATPDAWALQGQLHVSL